MRILVKNVGQEPEVRDFDKGLKAMQEIVGGYIETLHVGNNVVMVCNEEGKLNGLKPNFRLANDIIVGNVFFSRDNQRSDFEDLTDDDIEGIKAYLARHSFKD